MRREPITVKHLIAILNNFENKDRIVVLSTDSEGNEFCLLGHVETAAYDEGEVFLEKLTSEDIEAGYSEEDVMEDGTPAVVLWP